MVTSTYSFSQINLKKLKKAKSQVEKEIKTTQNSKNKTLNQTKNMSKGPCDSAHKSLTKYLKKLEDKKAANQVSSGSFKTYIGSTERYLKSIKSKCPDLDVSTEESQLNTFKSDLNNAGGADGARQANIRKGYYDKAIDNLVTSTHPAYNDFKKAKSQFLVIAFEHYRHQKPTESFKLISESKNAFSKIKSEYSDLDFSLINSELKRLEGLLKSESGSVITSKLARENDRNYFKDMSILWNSVYTDHDYPPDGLYGGNMQFLTDKFKDFTKQGFFDKVESSKKNGTYPAVQSYAEKVSKGLNDYPRYINQVLVKAYKGRLDDLTTFGIKGDPQKELEVLEGAKKLAELALKFAPNNPTAKQWFKEVSSQIGKKTSGITYASSMHKTYLGEMLFSTKEISIGSENESDFSSSFKSGDYIYATVYLPAKLRKLTDSYAANDVKILINGGIISEPESTAVWVTTPMQEKNYLQFAIIPNEAWKQKYGKFYIENKLRTHEHIANALITAGPYSGTTVSTEVFFRGTNSSIKGEFKIDLSGGIDKLKTIVNQEENARLADAKLPKAGMQNTSLVKEALGIMQRKSGGSKTYTKAIITSVNWDYDKNWNGVIVSRSIVVALVSKEHNGKCMYQYFNFKQQAQGSGKYNSNLEFVGAGHNVYISCDNAN
ncbi:hypothetical protein FBALC1_09897 [Flavobacteriales bacterium ALC-1]|nr:hypothetical protein FBALC1_09897 [Flavobacteriales bacterium ALC-1]